MKKCQLFRLSTLSQVWFQNARAKEKKSKLAFQQTFGNEVEFSRPPEECKLCNFTYSHKYTGEVGVDGVWGGFDDDGGLVADAL